MTSYFGEMVYFQEILCFSENAFQKMFYKSFFFFFILIFQKMMLDFNCYFFKISLW
jgi:hypothetical protein